jgi:hypothetical protein
MDVVSRAAIVVQQYEGNSKPYMLTSMNLISFQCCDFTQMTLNFFLANKLQFLFFSFLLKNCSSAHGTRQFQRSNFFGFDFFSSMQKYLV